MYPDAQGWPAAMCARPSAGSHTILAVVTL